MVDYGYDIALNYLCTHKYYIFHRNLIILSFYICLHHSFHKHIQCLFVSKSNPVLATKQVVIRTLLSQGVDSTWYHLSGCLENILHWVITQFIKVALYVLMKRIWQANIKRQKHQTSLKNVMFMSAKTVLSDVIPIIDQKGNRLYDIFTMKVAFSSFYFVLRVFLLTFDLF